MFFLIFQDTCKALWCYRGNKRCETKFLPAAEGTSCGRGMVGRHSVYFTLHSLSVGPVGPDSSKGGEG